MSNYKQTTTKKNNENIQIQQIIRKSWPKIKDMKNQMKILKLKNMVTEIKNSMMDSTIEWKEQSKESLNLKKGQYK